MRFAGGPLWIFADLGPTWSFLVTLAGDQRRPTKRIQVLLRPAPTASASLPTRTSVVVKLERPTSRAWAKNPVTDRIMRRGEVPTDIVGRDTAVALKVAGRPGQSTELRRGPTVERFLAAEWARSAVVRDVVACTVTVRCQLIILWGIVPLC